MNQKAKYIAVAFQDTSEELLPAPRGELHLWLPCKLLEVSIPWQTLLSGVICWSQCLGVWWLEQPFVQSFGVTGQCIGKHMESSAQWKGLIAQVNAQDSLADFCGGDIERCCLLAPDPRGGVTVVAPPVNHPFLHSFVVSDLGVRRTTVDACPAVRLLAIVF